MQNCEKHIFKLPFSRGPLCTLFWHLSYGMRANGRAHTPLILPISWTRMGSLSRKMPSCLSLQVSKLSSHFLSKPMYLCFPDDPKLFLVLSQVAGCVSERVWLGWSCSSSLALSCSTFVSLLHLEWQRMTWIWHQLWASPSALHPINCVLSYAYEGEDLH